VGSALVIVPLPGTDFGLGVIQGQKPVGVKTLLAQAPIEAFHTRVIGRFARSADGVGKERAQVVASLDAIADACDVLCSAIADVRGFIYEANSLAERPEAVYG
jgi:hypothetical protein